MNKSTHLELNDALLSAQKEKKSGRVYVYYEADSAVLCVWITLRKGEILAIEYKQGFNGTVAPEFWTLPIRRFVFIEGTIPEDVKKSAVAGDILSQIKASSAIRRDAKSRIWELSERIDQIIHKKGLDKIELRGKIGLRAGVLMNFTKNTPGDNSKLERLRIAATEILGETV